MIPCASSFICHAIRTRKFVPAVYTTVDKKKNPLGRPLLIRPEHFTFEGGVGVTEFDRRHRVGKYINLVVGRATHGTGWMRGYKQAQSIAIGHIVGHWPPPRPARGATWYDLGNHSTIGLECLDELMAHSRHVKS